MNRIIKKHYPASKLPADLRGDIPLGAVVDIVIEEEAERPTLKQLRQQLRMRLSSIKTSPEKAVDRIRKLRDEWDE